VALPEDLLAQAKHLASREPKRPRQASLRRAVSTAYYSLYHLLVAAGSRAMAPAKPIDLRVRVQRAFVHAEMKKVCQQFRQGSANNLSAALQGLIAAPLSQDIANVADAFVELQEARHAADYDTSEVFTRPDVLAMIDNVDQAFTSWKTVKETPNANVFLAALLLEKKWRSDG
jgi:uncharacterized protein (UPF0332 family)